MGLCQNREPTISKAWWLSGWIPFKPMCNRYLNKRTHTQSQMILSCVAQRNSWAASSSEHLFARLKSQTRSRLENRHQTLEATAATAPSVQKNPHPRSKDPQSYALMSWKLFGSVKKNDEHVVRAKPSRSLDAHEPRARMQLGA